MFALGEPRGSHWVSSQRNWGLADRRYIGPRNEADMDSAVPVIQLQPGSGILGLSFGATRHAVHQFFGAPQFSERSLIGCDADRWPGVAAHFSSDDRLQALELGPQCACLFDGTMISALDFDGAVAFLTERDQQTLSCSEATHFGQLSMTVCRSGSGPAVGLSFVLDRKDSGDWWSAG